MNRIGHDIADQTTMTTSTRSSPDVLIRLLLVDVNAILAVYIYVALQLLLHLQRWRHDVSLNVVVDQLFVQCQYRRKL